MNNGNSLFITDSKINHSERGCVLMFKKEDDIVMDRQRVTKCLGASLLWSIIKLSLDYYIRYMPKNWAPA